MINVKMTYINNQPSLTSGSCKCHAKLKHDSIIANSIIANELNALILVTYIINIKIILQNSGGIQMSQTREMIVKSTF